MKLILSTLVLGAAAASPFTRPEGPKQAATEPIRIVALEPGAQDTEELRRVAAELEAQLADLRAELERTRARAEEARREAEALVHEQAYVPVARSHSLGDLLFCSLPASCACLLCLPQIGRAHV